MCTPVYVCSYSETCENGHHKMKSDTVSLICQLDSHKTDNSSHLSLIKEYLEFLLDK